MLLSRARLENSVQTSRMVLVRHGETEGESSIRFHGSNDVPLSDEGRAQLRETARRLPGRFDLVAASPLSRAWEGSRILAPGMPVRLLDEFREIDFGDWEGLTREEIAARSPTDYASWQAGEPGFEFPGG